jgi:hypothetical protein
VFHEHWRRSAATRYFQALEGVFQSLNRDFFGRQQSARVQPHRFVSDLILVFFAMADSKQSDHARRNERLASPS